MGEAKRRNAQGRQLADELRRRLHAGEFGQANAACRWLIVLDKSPSGRETLAALSAAGGFAGLPALLEAEPLRLWEVSALFEFIVLIGSDGAGGDGGGDGTPERRSLLAAGTDRLVHDVLPRAWRRLGGVAGGPVGVVCGVGEAVRGRVQAALQPPRG